jgi:hypothetical protein
MLKPTKETCRVLAIVTTTQEWWHHCQRLMMPLATSRA